MKIKVAIVGYGNLGKAIEQQVLNEKNIKLVAIFSRRNIKAKSSTPVYATSQILKFKNKVDLLILCNGSQSDMFLDAQTLSKHFNTINSFDTHSKIPLLYKKLDYIAKKTGHIAILAVGWDPGLFSTIKAMFSNISNSPSICFWGKGISLGHSQAARQIENVKDAISLTLPNNKAKSAALTNKPINSLLHKRQVFVVSKKTSYNSSIRQQILNLPHYFKGQDVDIKFVSQQKLNKLKNLKHKGEVICSTPSHLMHLKVVMQSNPEFTAKIMLSYVCAFKNIQNNHGFGAYTPLHFSALDLSPDSTFKTIKKYC